MREQTKCDSCRYHNVCVEEGFVIRIDYFDDPTYNYVQSPEGYCPKESGSFEIGYNLGMKAGKRYAFQRIKELAESDLIR